MTGLIGLVHPSPVRRWIERLAWFSFLVFMFLLPFKELLRSSLSMPQSLLLLFISLGIVERALSSPGRWVRSRLAWPLWSYALVMLTSSLLSIDVHYSLLSLVHDLLPLLIIFHATGCLVSTPGRMRQFLWILLTASAIVLVMGFFSPSLQDGRLQGIFPVATRYGKYLDLLIPLSVSCCISAGGTWAMAPVCLLVVGQVVALAWNATRGAAIGIFSALLFMSIFWKRVFVALVLMVMAGGLFFGFWPDTDRDLARIEGLFRSPSRLVTSDPALRDRKGYFETSIAFIRERPVLGWGYGRHIARFVTKAHPDDWYLKKGLKPLKWHAHNVVLEVLLEGGIMGLAAVAWIFWTYILIVRSLLVVHKIYIKEPVVLGFVGAIVAISLHSMVSVPQWSNTLLAASYISVTAGYFSKKSCAGCGQPV